MRTLSGLFKDMCDKAIALGYTIELDPTGQYFEFIKDGIAYEPFRKFYNDCTISEMEYNQKMAKIK